MSSCEAAFTANQTLHHSALHISCQS